MDESSDEGVPDPDSPSSNSQSWNSQSSHASANCPYASSSEGYGSSPEEQGELPMDSLTLALQELQAENSSANFFRAHQRIPDLDGDFPELQKAPPKRSSSLKSKKTPPGTPNQIKKAVRFADTFGLDLTYVRHVFDSDDPPVIPPQAIRHLHLDADVGNCTDTNKEEQQLPRKSSSTRKLIVSPRFAQPGDSINFIQRVMAQKVMLERATVSNKRIQGTVRVANLGFEKDVMIRMSLDNWITWRQVPGNYTACGADGATDRFDFHLPAPRHSLAFCIRYCVMGDIYWDNNYGDNYCFDCYSIHSVTPAS